MLISNELLKFRRSHVWTIIVIIPFISVAIGAANYLGNIELLNQGWASYFSQIVLFYGLLFMTVGVAILAAASWRLEHRGFNWNQIMTSSRPRHEIVSVKIVGICVLLTLMQICLTVLAIIVGFALGIPGAIPWVNVAAIALALIPGAAVVTWQSYLSMVIRNFAIPIAIAVGLCVFAIGIVSSGMPGVNYLLPPALVTQTLQLGSTAMSTAGSLTVGTVMPLMVASLVLIGLGWAASVLWLRRSDIHS